MGIIPFGGGAGDVLQLFLPHLQSIDMIALAAFRFPLAP